jgi:hypothetical protein
VGPGATGEFAKGLQLSQLGFIGSVVQATGPQRITQREAAVIALEDLTDVVEAGVKRILLVVIKHPLGQDAAAPAHDAGEATLHLRQVFDQQTRVNGLVVNALLAVLLDDVQEVVFGEPLDRAVHALQSLIDRHGANRNRRSLNNGRAYLIKIDPSRGEIHDRISAVSDRQLQFFELFSHITSIG